MAYETAMALIRQERERQIKVEGWTAEHDDEHENGEMLRAAVIYLHHGTDRECGMEEPDDDDPLNQDFKPTGWPWAAKWWKPKDRQRNLERAGALCLAEKDRLTRARSYSGHVDQKLDLIVKALDQALV